MDEFNNNENKNFGEESFADKERREEQNTQQDAGSQPEQSGYDPYNMPFEQQQRAPQAQQPYNTSYANNGQQQVPPDYDPYKQPFPQAQQPYNTSYANNGQQQVPPDFDPYKQPLPQGQYQYNGMYTAPNGMPYKTGLATASLVIGILSLVLIFTGLIFIPPLGFLPIVGIILGCVYKSKHYPVGKGTSTAGITCSAVALVLSLLFIVLIVYVVMNYMPEVMQMLKSTSPDVYQQYYDMFHDTYPDWFNTAAALFAKFIIK